MKRILSFLLALTVMFGLLGTGAFAADYHTDTIQVAGTLHYDMAEEVFAQLNQHRRENGLKPLVLDKKLTDAAMLRAVESYVYFDHVRPNGYKYNSLIPYGGGTYAENQAWGQYSANSAMTAWKNSSGHNSNMLLSTVTHVGIGCASVNGNLYWIQLFFSKGQDNVSDYASVTSAPFRYNIEVLTQYLKTEETQRTITLTPDSTYQYVAEYRFANVSKDLVPYNFKPSFIGNGYDLIFAYDNSGRAIASLKLYSGTMNQITITPMEERGEATVYLYAYPSDPTPIALHLKIDKHEHVLGTPFVKQEATCYREGILARFCSGAGECDLPDGIYTEPIPKLEHDLPDTPSGAKEPTCSFSGYTGDYICKTCRTLIIEGEHIPPTHKNISDWIVDERNSTPERTLRYKKCLDCNGITESEWVENGTQPTPPPTTEGDPFDDVSEGIYYYKPVLWAVEQGITTGTSKNTFSPDQTCTRAQVVTFLHRAAGCPTPASDANPFSDVPKDEYYYNAVLWAVEQGITKGTSDTTFGPDEGCTRAQVVTFLHRAADGGKVYTPNPFTDVVYGSFYYDPVLWAVEQGITTGTSKTTFAPDDVCSRAQIVTFLYRAYNQ